VFPEVGEFETAIGQCCQVLKLFSGQCIKKVRLILEKVQPVFKGSIRNEKRILSLSLSVCNFYATFGKIGLKFSHEFFRPTFSPRPLELFGRNFSQLATLLSGPVVDSVNLRQLTRHRPSDENCKQNPRDFDN
jgi:hypothetical protein